MDNTDFIKSIDGPEHTYVLNMSQTNDPDMTKLEVAQHTLVLFDEMKAASAIANKKLFQCTADVCTLGQTPTQQHADRVFTSGTKFVVCSNTWFEELQHMEAAGRDWLSHNSVTVRVTEPFWQE